MAVEKKGNVIVFLSSECPCSESHQSTLVELAKSHPEFTFIGVHSNKEESVESAKIFFSTEKNKLPFPVIEDKNQTLANDLGALKTPHVFVFDPKGEIQYRGGIDDSHEASRAKKHFLAMALDAMVRDQKPATAEMPPLGCVISR